MTTTQDTTTTPTRTTPGRAALIGAGAGVIASLAMAMYAMVASWAKGDGFFTPLYHIASLFIAPDTMMTSMHDAMAGSDFHLVLGPAVLGAMVHMMTGAMYGAVFALLVSRLSLSRARLAGVGTLYGAMVFAVSAWIGLPIAAAVFSSGDQITHMAELAGWGTFLLEHLMYGLVLGLVLGLLLARRGLQRDS